MILILTLAAAAGCQGDPDRLTAVPAAGSVTYKGKPVDHGFVQFAPERGRSASGRIGQDGTFKMTTYDREGDGAIPGTHRVGVIVTQEVPGKGGREPEVRYIVPQNFADSSTSGLTVVVPPEGKTDITIAVE